ncbi:MAG: glycosyltransferase [Aliishimia sp.]
MPSILFIHENFPAQFGGISVHLAKQGWQVVFATAAEHVAADGREHDLIPGVKVIGYRRARDVSSGIHPYLHSTEKAVLNAQAFSRLGAALNKGGFIPDIVVAHSGWGSGSLARVVWPKTRIVQYLEWWYHQPALDVEPNTIHANPEDTAAKTLCRNLPFLLDAQTSDAILVPTRFQAEQVPDFLRSRVTVLHDGVDSDYFRPSTETDTVFSCDCLPDAAPIVTYATRGMEPLRGFPQFMKAWAQLQHSHPDVHCVVAGKDRVSYGTQLATGDSYKKRMLDTCDFDSERLHFVGHLPKQRYRELLQRSDAHIYLTRPFVLSWSMIEAMLTGAPIVCAKTAPVLEVAPEGTAAYVDIDQPTEIANSVSDFLNNPTVAKNHGAAAREHAKNHFSSTHIWPRLAEFYNGLLAA